MIVPEIAPEWGLGGLALSAFLSATLLPGGSEVLLVVLARQHDWTPATLLWTASLANTLGGLSTYGLGRLAVTGRAPVRDGAADPGALARVRHWGYSALLFSWLPIVGDGLCLAAGWLRMGVLTTALMLLTGKLARYGAVLWLAI
jgi:membrane protein YqaA with SNARE-associated domain